MGNFGLDANHIIEGLDLIREASSPEKEENNDDDEEDNESNVIKPKERPSIDTIEPNKIKMSSLSSKIKL